MLGPAAQRVLDRVDVGDCWLVPGESAWYARVLDNGRLLHAHRVVYEALVGPIPDGLELDHLCRVLRCVNPDHLEPVTHAENVARGVKGLRPRYCKAGHEFTPENTRLGRNTNGNVRRDCRTCHRQWQADYRRRKQA
jgi:hypothetical protein